jgi:hypothetical protein
MLACLNHISLSKRVWVLQEARRVLKDEGQPIITMINPVVGFFAHMIRHRHDANQLERDMGERAVVSGPVLSGGCTHRTSRYTDPGLEELARFARGLQDDLYAIQAGLTLPWSNGVTEGQIHRLTLVKRQGDGRVGFALIPQRLLLAAWASTGAIGC